MMPQSPLGYRQCCNHNCSVGVSAKLGLSRTNKLFMYKKADFPVIFTEKD